MEPVEYLVSLVAASVMTRAGWPVGESEPFPQPATSNQRPWVGAAPFAHGGWCPRGRPDFNTAGSSDTARPCMDPVTYLPEIVMAIARLVPVARRASLRRVCKDWRNALDERSMWADVGVQARSQLFARTVGSGKLKAAQ